MKLELPKKKIKNMRFGQFLLNALYQKILQTEFKKLPHNVDETITDMLWNISNKDLERLLNNFLNK